MEASGTSSRIASAGAIQVLEAAHAEEPDWQRWTLRVVDSARHLFGTAYPYAGTAYRAKTEQVELLGFGQLGLRSGPKGALTDIFSDSTIRETGDRFGAPLDPLLGAFTQLDPRWVDVFYRHRRHLIWHSELATALPAGVPDVNLAFFESGGLRDALALTGFSGDASLSIIRMAPSRHSVSPRERQTLLQVALHLEASLRARIRPEAIAAVIHPNGKIAHVERVPGSSLPSLSRHISKVEHARLSRVRNADDAIDAWSALISGRWALVEREDSDGSRHYLAIECETQSAERALSTTERAVVEMYARGVPGKLVAYGLGLTPGTVSAALGSATLKVGMRNRAAMLQLAAHLMNTTRTGPVSRLTQAEREVLQHLRQGHSNRQIAHGRGSSERTVANHVAAILRKLRLPSRTAAALVVD